jgi:hypothetical protein
LPPAKNTENRDLEAAILRRTGLVYSTLGANQKMLEYDK